MQLLIVDGHAETCAFVAASLLHSGFDVVSAYSIQQAHDELTHTVFDVVIIASMLPDGSGLVLCDKVRTLAGVHTVIIVTAIDRKLANPIVALELGADDFILLPFDFRELELRIAAHSRRRREIEKQMCSRSIDAVCTDRTKCVR